MSLAFDVGLFFRNSKTKLGLSLAARAVVFTLAFRVGTKSRTWVKPQTLADECGILRSNIFPHLKAILESGLIKKKSSKANKRNKIYSFSSLIKNYWQMPDDEKIKVHQALGDKYSPPLVDKRKNQSGKPDSKKLNQSGKPDSNKVDESGKPDSFSDSETFAGQQNQCLQPDENLPKGTLKLERDNKSKQRYKTSLNLYDLYPYDFFPDDKRRDLLTQTSKRVNMSEHELLTKFEKIYTTTHKKKSSDWQQVFEEFLNRELPKKVFEDKSGSRKRYDGQSLHS